MARIRFLLPALTVLAGLSAAHPALAQMDSMVTKPVNEPANQNAAPEKLPPGLPGAQSVPGTAATPLANQVPLDMPPTQALFDAINRGDIATARDALNRGADLEARNVLGMTPLDSAVDLGRNDIAFLLLSMRGSGGPSGPPSGALAQQQAAAASPRPGKPARIARGGHRAPERLAANTSSQAAPAAAQTPQLFSGDGGTPAPQVGFLGFDTARSR